MNEIEDRLRAELPELADRLASPSASASTDTNANSDAPAAEVLHFRDPAPRRRWPVSIAAAAAVIAAVAVGLVVSRNDAPADLATGSPATIAADASTTTTSSPPTTSVAALQNVVAPRFGIEFEIPLAWTGSVDGLSPTWEGEDGWVQVSAADALDGLPGVVDNLVNHQLRPFGSAPTVTEIVVDGADGRLIISSEDAPVSRGFLEAAIAIELAPDMTISAGEFGVLTVYADADHVEAIADSIRFLESRPVSEPTIAVEGMCLGIDPFLGGEPLDGTMDFGDAWPVLDDDLILTNGFTIVAFNDGSVRGTLLIAEAFPPRSSVFVDGAGGLVVQTRDRIIHARSDQTLSTLTIENDADSSTFPGHSLAGTAQIAGEWFAYAVNAPASAYEVGQGDLVLLPLDGGPEQIVAKVVQEEGGAQPYYDSANEVFVLDWGSQGDRWITGVTATGATIEMPWNQWSDSAYYELDQVIVGVNGRQAYRGTYDQAGNLTLEGFDSSTGNPVYPRQTLSIGPTPFITRLIPLEDRIAVSADTPDGPCTRIFNGDATYVDVEFRGFATPPAGLYGVETESSG